VRDKCACLPMANASNGVMFVRASWLRLSSSLGGNGFLNPLRDSIVYGVILCNAGRISI
jgi:hypothetical protein